MHASYTAGLLITELIHGFSQHLIVMSRKKVVPC